MSKPVSVQVWDAVCGQDDAQRWDQVDRLIEHQVSFPLWEEVWTQTWDQVGERVMDEIKEEVRA